MALLQSEETKFLHAGFIPPLLDRSRTVPYDHAQQHIIAHDITTKNGQEKISPIQFGRTQRVKEDNRCNSTTLLLLLGTNIESLVRPGTSMHVCNYVRDLESQTVMYAQTIKS